MRDLLQAATADFCPGGRYQRVEKTGRSRSSALRVFQMKHAGVQDRSGPDPVDAVFAGLESLSDSVM